MPSLEGVREDVHGTTLALRDTALAAEQLANQTGDAPAAQHREWMRTVRGDDVVMGRKRVDHANGDSFLFTWTPVPVSGRRSSAGHKRT